MSPSRLHADEVDIDGTVAHRLITEQMPEFATLPIRRVSSGGTDNAVFRLGNDLSLRMPRTPGAADGLRKELRWLPVLAPHVSLDVPEIVAAGKPDVGYPFPWTVVRWLEGEDAALPPVDPDVVLESAAISTVVVVFFVLAPLTLLLPASWAEHFVQYLPANAGARLFSGNFGVVSPLSPWTGFAVMCAYAFVLVGLAAWRLRRVDA